MAVTSTCRACGGSIEISADGAMEDAVAMGDEFFHRGCIEAAPTDGGPTGPAYFIPKGW